MVVIIYPSMHAANPGSDIDPKSDLVPDEKVVPFGALSVASIVAASGEKAALVDCRFLTKQEALERIEALLPEAVMVGFSVMTVQIPHALSLTTSIKARRPNLAVAWGGIHPTLFPNQTLEHPSIDYIINGEGAENISRLVAHVRGGPSAVETIPGLGYKRGGAVCINPPADSADVNTLPPLDYSLLDIENYTGRKLLDGRIVRGLDVLTSRGCPYRCTFCVNASLHHRKWRPIDSERVVNGIEALVKTYRLDHVWFADDYMFASKRRVEEILKAMMARGLNVTWEANIRANNFGEKKIDDESLKLMKDSGCVALTMGFESGADRILQFYKKDITVADIYKAVDRCKQYGIYVKGFFIMGTPSETTGEILATFTLIYNLTARYDRYVPNAPGIYRPYPGGELYEYTISHYPFQVPASLEAWASACASTGYLDPRNFPWIENLAMLNELRFYGRLMAGIAKGVFNKPLYLPVRLLAQVVKLRFRTGFWHLRLEAKLFYVLYGALKRHYRILKWLRIPYHM